MSDRIVNIVGVGNVLMGDDGAGPGVIDALGRLELPARARLHDAGLAVSDVLGTLDPDDPLIVIDSLRAGGRPGDIYRMHLPEVLSAEASAGCGISLHEISVAPALRIEALTGREFRKVTVFGIEPERLAWGEGLSPAVRAAVGWLAEIIREEAGTLVPCQSSFDGCHGCAVQQPSLLR